MKLLKLKLIDKDVENGIPNSSTNCPIGQCLKRSGYKSFNVYHGAIIVNGKIYRTTEEIRSFIDSFDQGKRVELIEISIPVCNKLTI